MCFIFIFIHQAGSNINNYNNRKLNYKHLIKYYKLLQNYQKLEIYRNRCIYTYPAFL